MEAGRFSGSQFLLERLDVVLAINAGLELTEQGVVSITAACFDSSLFVAARSTLDDDNTRVGVLGHLCHHAVSEGAGKAVCTLLSCGAFVAFDNRNVVSVPGSIGPAFIDILLWIKTVGANLTYTTTVDVAPGAVAWESTVVVSDIACDACGERCVVIASCGIPLAALHGRKRKQLK